MPNETMVQPERPAFHHVDRLGLRVLRVDQIVHLLRQDGREYLQHSRTFPFDP